MLNSLRGIHIIIRQNIKFTNELVIIVILSTTDSTDSIKGK